MKRWFRHRRTPEFILGWTLSFLLLLAGPVSAAVECSYIGTECNDGYAAQATFECISGSTLRVLITNTSTIDASDPGNNVLSSISFNGAVPLPSDVNRATVAAGSELLPRGRTDCSGTRNGSDVTCEWSAGVSYCANGPECDGVDPSCKSAVSQCGLSFVSSRQTSDVRCSPNNFLLEPGSIDSTTDGADFGVIARSQSQPEGGFERIDNTVEIVLGVGTCVESEDFCDGVATFGPHFRHAVGNLANATLAPPPPPTTTGFSFLAALAGSNEVPPNGSPASGTAVATLNANDTLTYTVASSGFFTRFRAAHVHTGAAGINGPIMFPLECDTEGTSCDGTSRPLTTLELTDLLGGDTYVNLHTDELPGGEIRGELVLTGVTNVRRGTVKKFEGKAKPVGKASSGQPRSSEIRMSGRFRTSDPIDLSSSTAILKSILDEDGGAGELLKGEFGEEALPIPMRLARSDSRGEAIYKTVSGALQPRCRLAVQSRGRRVYDFSLRCKRTDGASVPMPPLFCDRGRRPLTELTTSFIVNGQQPWMIQRQHPWRCIKGQGNVRELASLNTRVRTEADTDDAETGNHPPRAEYRPDPRRGNAPLTVNFTDRSQDSDGSVVDYTWDFGDGVTSNLRNPSHTYLRHGQFEVTLVVMDDQGAISEAARQLITVGANRAPVADFRADPRRGDAPLTVTFDNRSSDPDGDIVAHGWTFGDGTGSVEEDPTHTFTQPGLHIVTLMVRDDQGITSEVRTETITVQGRASSGSGTGPSGGNEPDNRPPRAHFQLDVRTGIAPLTVEFFDQSTDPDGRIAGYRWAFGDGTASPLPNPTHVYVDPGQYTVTLIVIDERGLASEPRRNTISVGANRLPHADFRADPRSGPAPLTVQFMNRSSDQDGEIIAYSWDFGDDTVATDSDPEHTYTEPGRYEVTLTVTDDRHAQSERTAREVIEVK